MTAFVSVVVPTFNRPAALASCLDALARQDYPADRYEMIVVDDGSAPTEAAAIAETATRHRVRLVRQENRGPAAARNAGVREAHGAYIAFTDDDCMPAPGWLAALAAAAAPDRALGGRTLNAVAGNAWAEATQLLIDYLHEYYADREDAFFTSNNLMMPRDRLLAIGGFDDTIPHAGAEDREVCARWRDRGGELRHVREAIVQHGHVLTFSGFWRQHFTYGLGAWRYRLSRATWTDRPVRLEPFAFYRNLVVYPWTHEHGWRAAALLVVAQVANAAGYFYARGWAGRRRSASPRGGSSAARLRAAAEGVADPVLSEAEPTAHEIEEVERNAREREAGAVAAREEGVELQVQQHDRGERRQTERHQ